MGMLLGPINSGAAVGGNGVATSTGITNVPVRGLIRSVYVKYNDAPPAGTTDITVKTQGTAPAQPSITILTKANAATDGIFLPRMDSCKTDGTAKTTDLELIPVDDYVQVVIDQANAGDNIDVWLMVD